MIVSIGIPNLVIVLSGGHASLLIGISLYVVLFPFFISRYKYITGLLKFDKNRYHLPVVGELVSIEKDFYFDDRFLKFINPTDPSIKPSTIKINRLRIAKVVEVVDMDGDWNIFLKFDNENIVLPYFESRRYWKTKSDIRNERLKKIGI
jgi:hypothetical protein